MPFSKHSRLHCTFLRPDLSGSDLAAAEDVQGVQDMVDRRLGVDGRGRVHHRAQSRIGRSGDWSSPPPPTHCCGVPFIHIRHGVVDHTHPLGFWGSHLALAMPNTSWSCCPITEQPMPTFGGGRASLPVSGARLGWPIGEGRKTPIQLISLQITKALDHCCLGAFLTTMFQENAVATGCVTMTRRGPKSQQTPSVQF